MQDKEIAAYICRHVALSFKEKKIKAEQSIYTALWSCYECIKAFIRQPKQVFIQDQLKSQTRKKTKPNNN